MTTAPAPKRLLMTADTMGGVWTYALELVQALESYGISVTLATMGHRLSSEHWDAARHLPHLDFVESDFKLEWMQDPWADVQRAGEWLLGLEARFEPDIVHLNGYTHGGLPWKAPVLMVGHSCVLSWWLAVKGEPAPEDWDRYRREVSHGLAAADLVVAPTQAMLSMLDKHYGPFRASRVIPNGRRLQEAPPIPKEPFILSAGRVWDEAKNIAVLEKVAPRLSWPVAVAGEVRHPEGGDACCSHVRFLGRLEARAMEDRLRRASIYVLPARYEPFGLSALEAALAGCALVLGDIPSLRETWEGAALFAHPEDDEAITAALNKLIFDAPYRTSMAERARVRALQFTPAQMAEGYMKAYRELLGQRFGQEEAVACVS